MEKNFQEQIDSLEEDLSGIDNFTEFVVVEGRNDLERKFRDAGKKHRSVIGQNNSCVDSIDHLLGGCLHNEIGLINDCLENLYKGLKRQKLESVIEDIKSFVDSPKSRGGLGCTPAQYHGGQYNGKRKRIFHLNYILYKLQARTPLKSSLTVMSYLRRFLKPLQRKMTTRGCLRHFI